MKFLLLYLANFSSTKFKICYSEFFSYEIAWLKDRRVKNRNCLFFPFTPILLYLPPVGTKALYYPRNYIKSNNVLKLLLLAFYICNEYKIRKVHLYYTIPRAYIYVAVYNYYTFSIQRQPNLVMDTIVQEWFVELAIFLLFVALWFMKITYLYQHGFSVFCNIVFIVRLLGFSVLNWQ